MLKLEPPCLANNFYEAHIMLLLNSYQALLGKPLLERLGQQTLGQQVFAADFALLSHTADPDPLFNYGNQLALELFELSWNEFIGMPSRYSVDPMQHEKREQLLTTVAAKGFVDDYTGVRIAKSGKRFRIQQAVIWNVFNPSGEHYGQAACFPRPLID